MTSALIISWLLTYAAHSTLLIGATWVLVRTLSKLSHAARARLWRAALVGALATTSAQIALDVGPLDVSLGVLRSTSSIGAVEASSDEPATVGRFILGWLSVGWTSMLVVFWMLGVTTGGFNRLRSSFRTFRSLGDRTPVDDEKTEALLREVKMAAGIQRAILLTSSQMLRSPIAVGLSEICIPHRPAPGLGRDEIRAVLAHELAHLERRDPIWLIISEVVETLFFFQPLNRIARDYAETEAEYACDVRAVEWTDERTALARSLANVASWVQSDHARTIVGIAGRKSTLYDRVDRVLKGTGISECTGSRLLSAGIITALVCSVVVIGPSLSVEANSDADISWRDDVDNLRQPGKPTATPPDPDPPFGVEPIPPPPPPSIDPEPPGRRLPSGPVPRPVPSG